MDGSTILALVAGLAAFLWTGFAVRLAAARRRAPPLPAPLTELPSVAILLPVRNEEANLAACLTTLLASTAPIELRVIDDGSSDRTAAIAREFAGHDTRVKLLSSAGPRPGESGKVRALATGADGVAAEWILSTDADTRHAPDLLARALAAARENRLDLVSLAGRQIVRGLGENLATPAAFALLDFLLGDWTPHALGQAPEPVANGQFMLLRRTALEAVGGYESIAAATLDDVRLAERLHVGGCRCGFWRALDGLEIRMYRGFGGSLAGWRRNFALFVTRRRAVTVAAIVIAATPFVLVSVAAGRQNPIALAIALLGSCVASALHRGSARFDLRWLWLAPLEGLALATLLALALVDRGLGRSVRWRGRSVSID